MRANLLIVVFLFATLRLQSTEAFGFYWLRKPTAAPSSTTHKPGFQSRSDGKLSPVILLPGDGGSRLEAKLNRKDVMHKYCERRSDDWFDLWVNLSLLVPFAIDCWVEK